MINLAGRDVMMAPEANQERRDQQNIKNQREAQLNAREAARHRKKFIQSSEHGTFAVHVLD
ncbi:MAG: hypothetical protein V4691_04860 [Pseudomonadota bacterium]